MGQGLSRRSCCGFSALAGNQQQAGVQELGFSSLVTVWESNLFCGPGKETMAMLRLNSTVSLAVSVKAGCI